MIDFRYHVVSLSAVFLALAVGVVLGSGPLRTALVTELTNQTAELKGALGDSQAETAAAKQEGLIGEAFVTQASTLLIGDTLKGRNVAVIRLQNPEGPDVAAVKDLIVEAGGTVSANLSIEPAWTDPGQSSFRSALAAQIVVDVVGVDATVAPDRVLAHALAQTLVPTEFPAGTTPAEGASATATAADRAKVLLDLLEGADLVTGTVTGGVDSVVFLVGPGPASADELAALSDVYSEIAGTMDAYVGGTVVAQGPSRDGDLASTIQVSALLDDNVSTVTDALNFYGHFTVVLALAQDIKGMAGHFGYGDTLLLYPGR